MRTVTVMVGTAAAAGVLVLGGCGSQPQSTAGASDASGRVDGVPAARVPAAGSQHRAERSGAGSANMAALRPSDTQALSGAVKQAPAQDPVVSKRAVFYTGDVALTSDDVAKAASKIRAVARTFHGSIADEQARADGGDVRRDRLTLRVPSGHFTAAMAAIKKLGALTSATSSTDDVTTEVIDVGVRVRAERLSLRRIEALMGRAQTIGQVIAIEGQLTRRQEALDSLEQRQAYLKDQTSLSTITAVVSRTPHHKTTAAASHHTGGFVGGLRHGWHALVVVGTAIAAGLGAALPFAVPVLVVGIPLWWVLRRRHRTRPVADAPAGS